MRRLPIAVLALCVAMVTTAGSASAEGTTTIAGDPAIAIGQQEFGNLSVTDPNWWSLPLTAGDSVQILWEAQKSGVYLRLYPPGTTDFNYEPHGPRLVDSLLEEQLKREVLYEATRSGLFELDVITAQKEGGPFSFTINVTHKIVISVPSAHTLHAKGVLVVPVHNPEGGPIDDTTVQVELQINAHGSWHTVGTAHVANSAATIPYVVPRRFRRLHVSLRAIAHGSGYALASSGHRRVNT